MTNPKHIFLVEPEIQLQFALLLILRRAGYSITVFENLPTAAKAVSAAYLSETLPLLLLADISNSNGFTRPWLRSQVVNPLPIPALLIAGIGDEHLIAEAMRIPEVHVIEKPFEPSELLGRMAALLEKKGISPDAGTRESAEIPPAGKESRTIPSFFPREPLPTLWKT